MQSGQGEHAQLDAQSTQPERTVSRRALLKAGWLVPVVLAVGIPRNAFAQYNGTGTET